MRYDVGGCVICISNKVEYLDKRVRFRFFKHFKKYVLHKFNCELKMFEILGKGILHEPPQGLAHPDEIPFAYTFPY